MTDPARITLQLAALFYLAAFVASWPVSTKRYVFPFLFLAALGCNSFTIYSRYMQSWPMLPMHLGALALPLCLALMLAFLGGMRAFTHWFVLRLGLLLCVALIVVALLFPKDFYLPFLKSKTYLSHAFLWFALFAKGACAISALWALSAWPFATASPENIRPLTALKHSLGWAALGFGLWTISMFCGELWCYLGWGTPVVWQDPALTLTMAGWFFYACVLHLHLTKSWNLQLRAAFIGFGGLVVLAMSCLPDFGPFRPVVLP